MTCLQTRVHRIHTYNRTNMNDSTWVMVKARKDHHLPERPNEEHRCRCDGKPQSTIYPSAGLQQYHTVAIYIRIAQYRPSLYPKRIRYRICNSLSSLPSKPGHGGTRCQEVRDGKKCPNLRSKRRSPALKVGCTLMNSIG